jgi:hypothetical protein
MPRIYSIKTCLNCGLSERRPGKKYCSVSCQQNYQYKEKVKNWLSGKITGKRGKTGTASFVKRYIIECRGHKCERCLNVEWMGEPVPLSLHHIDGKFENNSVDNLKLLCGNCHIQTPNYGSKNEYGRPRYKYWRRVDD